MEQLSTLSRKKLLWCSFFIGISISAYFTFWTRPRCTFTWAVNNYRTEGASISVDVAVRLQGAFIGYDRVAGAPFYTGVAYSETNVVEIHNAAWRNEGAWGPGEEKTFKVILPQGTQRWQINIRYERYPRIHNLLYSFVDSPYSIMDLIFTILPSISAKPVSETNTSPIFTVSKLLDEEYSEITKINTSKE